MAATRSVRRIKKRTAMACHHPCCCHVLGEHGEDEKEGTDSFLGGVVVVAHHCHGSVFSIQAFQWQNCFEVCFDL